MYFKKPKFWDNKNLSIFAIILLPFAQIIRVINFLKSLKTPNRFRVPVICVGNIYLGGTGKTPLSVEIFEITKSLGKKPAFVKKFYPYIQDEIEILKTKGEVFLEKNRTKSIKLLEQKGKDIAILDDGYQDLSIFKNLSIVCFNESEGVGNKQIIPAGPLRESLNSLSRADIVFIKGKKNNNFEKELKTFNQNIDIFYFNYEILNKEIIKDKKIIAFAGIGSNNNFFNLLTENNFNIFMTKSFPDHHLYKEKELDDLIKLAKENEALLLTTEKDYKRIKNKYYNNIKSVITKINIVDKNKFVGVLQKII